MPNPTFIVPTFDGQNWLITPAALAVNQAPPKTISDQEWLLVLSGVAIINLQGTLPDDWLHQTVTIGLDPLGKSGIDLNSPLQYAVSRWAIPVPPPAPLVYTLGFSLVEWAPFAGLNSVFEKNTGSVDAGFAVNAWRPTPFELDAIDIHNNPVSNLFQGIDVDLAVRNKNATLYRVGYNITLLGKIVSSRSDLN